MTIKTKCRCKTMPTPPRNGMVVVPQVITRSSKLSPRPSYASWSSRLSWSGLWSSSNCCRRVMGQRACSSARMATPSMEPIRQNAFTVRITSMPIMVILVVIYQKLQPVFTVSFIKSSFILLGVTPRVSVNNKPHQSLKIEQTRQNPPKTYLTYLPWYQLFCNDEMWNCELWMPCLSWNNEEFLQKAENIYICGRNGSGGGGVRNNGHLQKSCTIAFNFKLNYTTNWNFDDGDDDDDD